MICPGCYKAQSRVTKTADLRKSIVRTHRCPACGATWGTEEMLISGTLDTTAGHMRPLGGANGHPRPPNAANQPPMATAGRGGIGGDLPSGIDPDGSPDPSRQSDQEAPRARVPLIPLTAPRRAPRVGAVSLHFLRAYERYPNPFRKLQAAQTWQELAEAWPGGESALADEICAAFDAGMLDHKPYNGEAVPKFETVLAERLWEERAPAPVAAKPAETLHQREERAKREGHERRMAARAEIEAKERAAEAAIAARHATGGTT